MRYYLYISDSKVDMLLPQVPGTLQRKVATKVGFDIKLLAASIATERLTLDTRVARLQAVEAYILQHEQMGKPDQLTSWIEGDLQVNTVDIGEGAILFIAEAPSWILALGGSAARGGSGLTLLTFALFLISMSSVATCQAWHR